MKTISWFLRRRYMKSLVSAARRKGSATFVLNQNTVPKLLSRSDFPIVLSVLEGLGLIAIRYTDNSLPYAVTLTSSGLSFFERSRDECFRFIRRSILVPILVAFITAAVSVYILPPKG